MLKPVQHRREEQSWTLNVVYDDLRSPDASLAEMRANASRMESSLMQPWMRPMRG